MDGEWEGDGRIHLVVRVDEVQAIVIVIVIGGLEILACKGGGL